MFRHKHLLLEVNELGWPGGHHEVLTSQHHVQPGPPGEGREHSGRRGGTSSACTASPLQVSTGAGPEAVGTARGAQSCLTSRRGPGGTKPPTVAGSISEGTGNSVHWWDPPSSSLSSPSARSSAQKLKGRTARGFMVKAGLPGAELGGSPPPQPPQLQPPRPGRKLCGSQAQDDQRFQQLLQDSLARSSTCLVMSGPRGS